MGRFLGTSIGVAALLVAVPGTDARPEETQGKKSVAVVVHGDPRPAAEVATALQQIGDAAIELRLADLPNTVPPPRDDGALDAKIAAARRDYVNADFASCLRRLEGDELIPDLLNQENRLSASRVLLWRVGCSVGSGDRERGHRDALEMAAYGLDVPGDVASVSPEVEALIARAKKEKGQGPAVTVHLTSSDTSGRVSVDGRPVACTTPCTLELASGRHVFRIEVDGMEPGVKTVLLEGKTVEIEAPVVPASPVVAASQWVRRYAGTPELDSAPSLRLLATALRAPTLVLLNAESERGMLRLRGTLANEGSVEARVERNSSATEVKEEVTGLLRDLLVKGGVVEEVSLVKKPAFWVVVGAVVVAAGAAVAGTVYFLERPVQVGVRF